MQKVKRQRVVAGWHLSLNHRDTVIQAHMRLHILGRKPEQIIYILLTRMHALEMTDVWFLFFPVRKLVFSIVSRLGLLTILKRQQYIQYMHTQTINNDI